MNSVKTKMKSCNMNYSLSIPRIKKGETTITLINKDTGEKKVYHDTNMQTNALNHYLANCGWLNRDNLQDSSYRNRLAEEILGGVMLFDSTFPQDAECIKVPAGHVMIANCALGMTNTGSGPTEAGTCSDNASETGRINNKFMITYRWNEGQGNGTIRSLCACPINYAKAGEGNALSEERTATRFDPRGLAGVVTDYSAGISGWPFGVDLEKSICYSFDLTDATTNHYGVLRKYRLPISKVNLWGTQSAPVQLPVEYDGNNDPVYDKHVALPEALYSQALNIQGGANTGIKYYPFNGNLMLWNVAGGYQDSQFYNSRVWGDNWTQYLWTLEPDGTLTQETLLNTSGDELHCMENPIFDGNYIFFCWNYYVSRFENTYRYQNDTRTIYVLNRTTGDIDKIENPYGNDSAGTHWNVEDLGQCASGWLPYCTSGDGRIYIRGASYSYIVDAVKKAVYLTNAQTGSGSFPNVACYYKMDKLIQLMYGALYRDMMFISTINNLDEPIVKDSSHSMVLQYVFEFEDAEDEEEEEE